MIVEDNDLNAEIVPALLQAQGATTVRAANGKEAEELFSASSPAAFDVLLMDIQMPELNGLEATAAIRSPSRDDAKTIPIIAMTATAFKEDERAELAAGMTGFVTKPIALSELFRKVGRALTGSHPETRI